MIREIIKDIIKKKSSKSDFESLVKNTNLESESIIEESDYTSITSKQKERINNILNMLEPIALPSASPLSPFLVATIEVTSSGRDVPIATIVRPMKFWLTPKLAAMIHALSTTRLPPNITAIRPPAI